MQKYIVVTFDGKKYKVEIDDELDNILKSELQSDYLFDRNNFLIRNKENVLSSYRLNFKVLKALITAVSNLELPENYQKLLKQYKTRNYNSKPSAVSLSFLNRDISDLVLIYNEFYHKKDNENNLQEQENETKAKLEYKDPILNEALKVLLQGLNNKIIPNLITKEQIRDALNKVYICKDNNEFKELYIKYGDLTKEEAQEIDILSLSTLAFRIEKNGQIILRPDCKLEILIHELCHSLSFTTEGNSITIIAQELQKEDKSWSQITDLHINILNESLTDFVTELLLSKEIKSAYSNGTTFFRKYAYDETNLNEILYAYFAKDKEALNSIVNKVNSVKDNLWQEILDSALIYQATNLFLIPLKNLNRCKTEQEMNDIINNIKSQRKLT